ncbi:uncharacterized protein DUF445 [Thermodesulfitimonas autotrophica]|uniref:Uncharacterized protein DUF445 n=1 Tax=Thermodesulfitimonas autotrophica TaxID=1894989 RepID=A0A3N5BF03_9THEO|nr:DUF445 family protein [Thermodesulfitimonas autotrophica]RPF46672.1 uncharacterized protein DUF445 [Thermodesulfitimonas autotrophica]
MFYVNLILLPVVGAFIGWITNLLAIKLLFRPYKPYRIWRWTLQGVLPRRRYELARCAGEVIEREVLSVDDILQRLREREVPERAASLLREAVRQAVLKRVPGWVPAGVKKTLAEALSDLVGDYLPLLVTALVDSFGEAMKKEVSLGQLVEEKLNAFPLEDLERIIFTVARKEIKHIEVMGAVLGGLIGGLQALFLLLLRLTGSTGF